MSSTRDRRTSTGRGFYQCTQCQQTYSRTDHLARHIRSHLQERPFQCEICSKSFGRPDLLKRHIRVHDGDVSNASTKRQRTNRPATQAQSPRVSEACVACALAKSKCNDSKPCSRCQQLRIECEYSGDPRHVRTSNVAGGPTSEAMHLDQSDVGNTDEDQASPWADMSLESHNDDSRVVQMPTPSTVVQTGLNPEHHSQTGEESATFRAAPGFRGGEFSDFLRDVMAPMSGNSLDSYGQAEWPREDSRLRNVLDFNMGDDIDVGPASFGFLNGGSSKTLYPNLQPPLFEGSETPGSRRQPQPLNEERRDQHLQHPSRHREQSQSQHQRMVDSIESLEMGTLSYAAGVGAQAFQKFSLAGCWQPAQNDHTKAVLRNLSILRSEDGFNDQGTGRGLRFPGGALDIPARDKVLATLLSVCDDQLGATVAAAFPPPGLLNDLIQDFFSHHQATPTSFMHWPTFSANTAQPALLAAIIAYGAVLSDIKTVQKLGYAIQETIRIIVRKRCEVSNAVTRELWLLQALMLELEVGLWSGNSRQVEIAESHTQPLFAMLRRANRFSKSNRASFTPSPEDTGARLHYKWREWAQHESIRRLCFHAFVFDAQLSMSLLVNPSISYAEMKLPLPAPREVWMAEDAEHWKAAFMDQPPHAADPLSLANFLQQPLELHSLQHHNDVDFSSLAVLHGLWGMVWDFTQTSSALWSPKTHISALMVLRNQDLRQSLSNFRIGLSDQGSSQSPEVLLIVELLTMYLHVSLEKIQLFAGKEGAEEARQVLPFLEQWLEGTDSRQAIWSAGQVLRAARKLSAWQLRGFYAVAVYHAALTCWTYGLISQMRPAHDRHGKINSQNHTPNNMRMSQQATPTTNMVLLDGPETAETQRFIALGRGTPSIGAAATSDPAASAVVPLFNHEAVMHVVIDIVGNSTLANAGDETTSAPPLVENITQLMLDLGRSGASVARR